MTTTTGRISEDAGVFAGTDYREGDGLRRIWLPQAPPSFGDRPNTDLDAWMWYFAGWEPEYTWDSWEILSRNAPARQPLLADRSVEHGGQCYYRASHPDVVAWHVAWLRAAGVSTLLFQFIANHVDGEFTGASFGSRALETAFLGKPAVGARSTGPGPYADLMDFAVMWVNFVTVPPGNEVASQGLIEYFVSNYLLEPNYKRVDGRAVVPVWDIDLLVTTCGSVEAARDYIASFRAVARTAGAGELLFLGVNSRPDAALAAAVGIDGVTGYVHFGLSGSSRRQRTLADGKVIDEDCEDFPTQTLPGYGKLWRRLGHEFSQAGLDYILSMCPMQDWRPIERDWSSKVYENTAPEGFAAMLSDARAAIAEQQLRPIVVVEAFNEWGEGGYVEPSLEFGFSWLNTLRRGLWDASTSGRN